MEIYIKNSLKEYPIFNKLEYTVKKNNPKDAIYIPNTNNIILYLNFKSITI